MLMFNLHRPLSELEQRRNRRYSYAEVAEKSGLTRQGVRRLLTEQTLSIRVDTLDHLLRFFHAEGMAITVADLFVESDD